MKSTRTTMEGWEKKHWTSRLINSTQQEFCFAAEPLYTYAYLSLTNTSIYTSHTHTHPSTHTCTHTNTLFQSQAPDCSSLTWFASKEGKKADCGKKGLVCEAFWINASGLPLNIHYSAMQNHEKKRINGLIEILSKGIDKKLNNPSAMLLEKKKSEKSSQILKEKHSGLCISPALFCYIKVVERFACAA